MIQNKVLFIGYGIDPNRLEAVSINTLRLQKLLKKKNISSIVLNIGYKNLTGQIDLGNSMREALLNRKKIIEKVNSFIRKNNITHIHDVFVLPGASILFTLPLKKGTQR